MRLIDADELMAVVWGQIAEVVMDVPTIDPVRHGRWEVQLDARRFCKCSICGFRPEYKYNYCPNCGAMMEE